MKLLSFLLVEDNGEIIGAMNSQKKDWLAYRFHTLEKKDYQNYRKK